MPNRRLLLLPTVSAPAFTLQQLLAHKLHLWDFTSGTSPLGSAVRLQLTNFFVTPPASPTIVFNSIRIGAKHGVTGTNRLLPDHSEHGQDTTNGTSQHFPREKGADRIRWQPV
ncbi:MAG: hypothetical protein P8N76_09475 [Pirellulaceae bacterium]|nr:hypothetical protein [Pirellulaceae bacterium]